MLKSEHQKAERAFLEVLDQMEQLLLEDWGEIFIFDREAAIQTGKIILCWKKTNQPVPFNLELSGYAYERGNFTWRDVHRRLKACLPENVMKQSVSDINSMLRNANRRGLSTAFKDYKKWCQKTQNLLDTMLGPGSSTEFRKDPILPAGVKTGSIQALSFLIENKIDYLKSI